MFIKIPRGAVASTLGDVLELSLLSVETAQTFRACFKVGTILAELGRNSSLPWIQEIKPPKHWSRLSSSNSLGLLMEVNFISFLAKTTVVKYRHNWF